MKTNILLIILIIFSANISFASERYLLESLNNPNLIKVEFSAGDFQSEKKVTAWSINIDNTKDLSELKNILSHMRYCGLVSTIGNFKLELRTEKKETIPLELHIGFSSCFIRYRINGVANDYWDDGLVLHAFLKRIIDSEEKRTGKKFITPYNSFVIEYNKKGKLTGRSFRIKKPISVLDASKLVGLIPADDTKFTLFKGDGIFGNEEVIDCELWECVKHDVEAGDYLVIKNKE